MKVAFGCDHAGFALKSRLLHAMESDGHEVIDCGTDSPEPIDYPAIAEKIGTEVLRGEAERGVMVCGSGVGASIALNKLRGVRAGLCHDAYSTLQAVSHDNVGVLCLGARVIGPELAAELVRVFLHAKFCGKERHVRRLKMIKAIESKALESNALESKDPKPKEPASKELESDEELDLLPVELQE